MDKSVILADIGCAVLATLFLVLGMTIDGLLAKFALVWGGMLAGYVATTYLNWEEL
jgi:hypothetical protein